MLDTVDFNHVQHISFTQSRLTDAVSVILSESLSYEHPPNGRGYFKKTSLLPVYPPPVHRRIVRKMSFAPQQKHLLYPDPKRHLPQKGINDEHE